MKSEHRHELKTNELADWLANFPQWAKENRITIILVTLIIVVAAVFYIWRFLDTRAETRRQVEFTNLITQLIVTKMQVLAAEAEGRDISYQLLQPADNLKNFARTVGDNRIAAFALIKEAEARRMELHCRTGAISKEDLAKQINLAKDSYAEAVEKGATDPSLVASAKFGIGLCEEEIGNFQAAQQVYRDITANADFEGTVAKAAAAQRLETMGDYKTAVVFKPSVKPKAPVATKPTSQPLSPGSPEWVKPAETNMPIDVNKVSKEPNIVNDK